MHSYLSHRSWSPCGQSGSLRTLHFVLGSSRYVHNHCKLFALSTLSGTCRLRDGTRRFNVQVQGKSKRIWINASQLTLIMQGSNPNPRLTTPLKTKAIDASVHLSFNTNTSTSAYKLLSLLAESPRSSPSCYSTGYTIKFQNPFCTNSEHQHQRIRIGSSKDVTHWTSQSEMLWESEER